MRRIYKKIYFLVIGVIILIFLSNYIQFKHSQNIVLDNTEKITQLSAVKFNREIENWLFHNREVISYAAQRIEHCNFSDEEMLDFLKELMKDNPAFSSIYYGDKDNKMVNGSGWIPPQDFDLRTRLWYKNAIKEEDLIFTDEFVNASGDDIIITIAKPVMDYNGQVYGVIGGDVSIRTIISMIQQEKIGENGFAFLINNEGNIIAHPSMIINNNKVYIEDDGFHREIIKKISNNGEGFTTIDFNGKMGFTSHLPVKDTNWILVTYIPKYEFARNASNLTLAFILTSAISILIFLIIFRYNNKYVFKPLLELKESIDYIGEEKDLNYRIPKIDSRLFSSLRRAINDLLDRIEYQNSKFMALFKNSIDAIALMDNQHRVLDINTNFTSLFGYTIEEIKGKDIDELLSNISNYDEMKEMTKNALEGKSTEKEGIRYTKDRRPIHTNIKGVPVIIKNEVVGVYGIYSDITDKKLHETTLKYLSMHDVLTGLFNRGYFEEALSKYDNIENFPLTLILGDINGLKLTNDAFGHKEGDNLLIKIANVFKRVCKKDDIICRLGGDEFAIILLNTDEKAGGELCKKIIAECSKEKDTPVPLSISLGLYTKANFNQNIQEVFKEAENRMYRNKLLNSKSSKNVIIESLFRTLKEKTFETEEHCRRLAGLSEKVGKRIGMSSSEMDELRLLGTLHDIGKVAIPNHILLKKEKLTKEEWETIKKHPEIGHRIAQATPEMVTIAEKILCHHERWDGKGYPQGLAGEDIPLSSRILAIVDAYDVMVNGRPYKEPIGHEEAIEELKRCSGTQFDPRLVEIFIDSFKKSI